MFHAANFASQKKYRAKYFTTCPEDRPLIVQFCSNNAETLLEAAKHVENLCDGIDINLGCPQDIAKRGHYGAYIQEEWNLIELMISKLRNNLRQDMAVSCKIRRLDSVDKTVEYAKMLEKAGCTFIGLHARTRDQRGCRTDLADWSYIKAVKENVSIPVVANGNVQSLRDAEECLSYTGADAVMSAEGNLYNPAIFHGIHPPAWHVARKYLDCVVKYPVPAGMAKSHIFKLFHKCISMDENAHLRCQLGQSSTLEQLRDVIDSFERLYKDDDDDQTMPITVLPVPPYLCQPRFRYEAATTLTQANGCQLDKSTQQPDCSNDKDNSSSKRIKLDQ